MTPTLPPRPAYYRPTEAAALRRQAARLERVAGAAFAVSFLLAALSGPATCLPLPAELGWAALLVGSACLGVAAAREAERQERCALLLTWQHEGWI